MLIILTSEGQRFYVDGIISHIIQAPWFWSERIRDSHLLALGRDVPRHLDDALLAVVVLVELITEALENVMEPAAGRLLPGSPVAIAVSLEAAGHSGLERIKLRGRGFWNDGSGTGVSWCCLSLSWFVAAPNAGG